MEAPQKKNEPTTKQTIGCLVVGALLLFIFSQSCSKSENKTGSSSEAWYIAKKFAEKDLKAPATADFPSQFADGVKITDHGGGKYTVKGYVDAQNSFGAKIRQYFMVEVQKQPGGDKWSTGGVIWVR